ncbi:MAG: pilus assembly protein PilP [Deltaproteobacteria bacterium]|nr:pilus assembly protein PilP [Deltaproteobacteria bacterium]MBW2047992.1 pilus assembly protein PilP [Deltaproteobacteria bacterium]MBW2111393.1 pilus assembly protein PilP [Deltaproteobacteria bacterium]MBW2353948.1 pilus assembly protein PilP [Deltaproteobacteria bacterium]HDZ90633.1 hypothetical protein [Deltaproteobacteria bacterium]
MPKIVSRFLVVAVCLAVPGSSVEAGPYTSPVGPVYKEMRPAKTPFDPDRIPDPFLSYLAKEGQQASLKAEEEEKKRQRAEERLKQERQAAEERLKKLREPKTELQKMRLSQLTLTAIIQGGDKAWAMVRDERGNGFVLKKGTYIGTNGGVVSRILIDEKKVVIKEPYLENGLHIRYKPVEIELPDRSYE